jgi:hypothetical protein
MFQEIPLSAILFIDKSSATQRRKESEARRRRMLNSTNACSRRRSGVAGWSLLRIGAGSRITVPAHLVMCASPQFASILTGCGFSAALLHYGHNTLFKESLL